MHLTSGISGRLYGLGQGIFWFRKRNYDIFGKLKYSLQLFPHLTVGLFYKEEWVKVYGKTHTINPTEPELTVSKPAPVRAFHSSKPVSTF